MRKTWLGQIIGFVGAFVRGFVDFFVTQWGQFNPIGQALFALAVVMVGVDAAISFKFGMSQTVVHAIGFAGLAIAFFLLPDAAVSEWRKGNFPGFLFLAGSCIPIGIVCLWTHVGYSSGVRLGDIQQDGYSKSSYERAGTALDDKRKTLAMLQAKHESARSKLEAAMKRNEGWSVSVDPTAMQSALASLDEKIVNEAAGKRGRGKGCLAECEKLKTERGQLAAAISIATEENDLAKSIRETEKEIEAKTAEVAALTPKGSTTVSQVQMAAKLINVVAYYSGMGTEESILKPSAFQQDMANTAASGASSIAFLIVGTTLMVGAGFNRKDGIIHPVKDYPASEPSNRTEAPPASPLLQARSFSPALSHVTVAQLRAMAA